MKFKRLILGLVLFVFIFGVFFAFMYNSKAYAKSNEETNETKIYWSAYDLYNSQAGVRKNPGYPDDIVETIAQNNTISGITLNVTEGTNPKNYGEVGWFGRKLFNDGNEENGFVFSTELGTITNIRICFREFYSDYLLKNPSAGWTKKTHTYEYDDTSEYAYEVLWEGTPSKEVILRGENIDIDLYGIEFTVKGDFNVSKINYDLNGGEFIDLEVCESFNNPQTTYIEGVETLLSTNVGNKYGYKFVGWCTDKELTNDIKTVPANATGDKVYYAKYEEVPKHNIIYHLDGGEFVGEYPNTFYENFSLKLPSNVIKEGVGFYRWKDENENFITEYDGKSEEDLELWAEYRNVYKITYHLNGGTWPENAKIEYTYIEGIGLTNIYDFNNWPVKDGKEFDGWFTDEELTEPLFDEPDRTGDVELWAKWRSPSINKRVITTEGKTVYEVDDIKITADNAGDEKGILINDENKISIDFSKVLYKINSVIMRFNGNLEYLVDTNFDYTAWYVYINRDYAIFDVSDYEADAFEFSLKDGNLYVKEIIIDGRYITSKISYVLDGGTIKEEFETEYDEGLGYTLPTNVTKDGLVFTGWFDNENFEGQPIKEITKNDKGDKTFYAYFSNSPEALVELVENSINNLPEEISLSNKEEILNARNRYESLNDEQKSSFSQEILAKLVAAEEKLYTLIAKDVSDNINNLPEISEITLDNKDAIVKAREAYNTLTDAQKAKVSKEVLDKLVAAENEIIDIEKSNEVGTQVNSLPTIEEVSLDDAKNIKAVKDAYDALTDSQKAKLSKETKEKLTAIITEFEALETVDNTVKELPTAENVSLDDLEKVKKAREAYDALTDKQKAKVSKETLDKLVAAEKEIIDIQKSNEVGTQVNALPTIEEVSLDDAKNIKAVKEAYDALTDSQKEKLSKEVKEKLTAIITEIETLENVDNTVKELPTAENVSLDDLEKVKKAREAYDALTDKQKAKVSKETLDKLVAAEKEIIDIQKSNEVGTQVNALPTIEEVSLDDAKNIKAVKEAYDALTDKQKAKLSKEAKEKLTAIITEIETLETVDNAVKELPTAENVSLDDLEKVKKAREAYNALTDSQKTKLGELNNVIIAIEKSLAGLVDNLIVNLGSVDEITFDNKNDILTARECYESLTEEQKAYVSEEHLNLLKALEAKCIELQDAFDTEVANDATSDINELPSADEITLDNKKQLDAVKEKYESLTAEQKEKISKETKEKLEAASAEIEVLESVYTKLDNLKTNISLEDEEAILQARASYNSLTPAQQQKIPADVVDKLESAEKKITNIKAINPVIDSIENLGVIIYNSETKAKLDRTLALYDSLTDEQKALIADEYKELQEAIKEYEELKADHDAVADATAKINAIGTVAYTADSKAKIDAARKAYDTLTNAQKALVKDVNTLTGAEAAYKKLEADNTAAANAQAKIDAIGKVAYNQQTKARIDAARTAYNALTADQKALVKDTNTLTNAEKTYSNVEEAYEKINSINVVSLSEDSKQEIDDARKAYESLTDEEKALVPNYGKLTSSETQYNKLVEEKKPGTMGAYIVISAGALAFVGIVIYIVLFKKKEEK